MIHVDFRRVNVHCRVLGKLFLAAQKLSEVRFARVGGHAANVFASLFRPNLHDRTHSIKEHR